MLMLCSTWIADKFEIVSFFFFSMTLDPTSPLTSDFNFHKSQEEKTQFFQTTCGEKVRK